ncbi:Phytanoyl-CoA dioxygenase (PhyH) [Ekhidna lutea]|uniref:Phytanoyl-CoA dioxygenase (PhyH) n=1 Tax=Ekhidna lutea TaxID=447679 RepID=A0A239FHU6_EKHLU|nr:phytanoyl-CoA dioxygenase family protein [Ekhidna lutea]SNS56325.1 Phytanoyl-CoA dioxygenase (PhyH) [Ekhidna lutea]
MINYLANNVRVFGNALKDAFSSNRIKSELDEKTKSIVAEIETNGYFIIEDFLTKEECRQLANEIDSLLIKFDKSAWKDEYNSDHRLYAADRKSNKIAGFFTDERIDAVAKNYMKSDLVGFTLGAKLTAKPENPGSGGGWHRDALKKQIKAIIYLTDVDQDHGPFEYFVGSHKYDNKIGNFIMNELKHHTRYTVEEIAGIASENHKVLTGKAGTLILVDTSGIHRGAPIQKGERYALTNYYWKDKIPDHISKLFI